MWLNGLSTSVRNSSSAREIRQISPRGASENITCGVCMDPLEQDVESLRLTCDDCIHYHCLVAHIRVKLGERQALAGHEGIPCPYGEECKSPHSNGITPVDIIALIEYARKNKQLLAENSGEEVPMLEESDVKKLTAFLKSSEDVAKEEAKEKKGGGGLQKLFQKVDTSAKYIEVTTKPCPSCGFRISRWHGHR